MQVKETPAAYTEIAKLGRDHGVGVSVVSIRGDDIKMEALGVVTSATGGTVDIVSKKEKKNIWFCDKKETSKVDATSLQTKLDAMSAPVLGTKVRVTLRCSDGVTIKDPSSGNQAAGVLTVDLPSVKADSDVYFDLSVPADAPEQLFVQADMVWTALDGSIISRVRNQRIRTSLDRDGTEKSCDLGVASIAALRECAMLAEQNRIQDGRIVLISTMRLLQRGMASVESQQVFLSFVKQAERLDGFLRELQQREETEKLLLAGKESSAKKDDYASRNVLQAKALSLADWKKAK